MLLADHELSMSASDERIPETLLAPDERDPVTTDQRSDQGGAE
jgi:hypothetical protein